MHNLPYPKRDRSQSAKTAKATHAFYFTDSGRRLMDVRMSAICRRQEAVKCSYFYYVIDPVKFNRELTEAVS
jgi:hypothetical protein